MTRDLAEPHGRQHLNVVRQAAGMFDEVVMCVLTNPKKIGRLPLWLRRTVT